MYIDIADANNGNEPIDNSLESANPYAFTSGGLGFLKGNSDSYLNAVNQQALWRREDVLRQAAEHREDFEIDRLFKAAERNGINPIFLLDAISGSTGNAASYTTSAAKANNYDTNARTEAGNSAKIAGAIISALALILGAAIAA